jgi:hypothetical protein
LNINLLLKILPLLSEIHQPVNRINKHTKAIDLNCGDILFEIDVLEFGVVHVYADGGCLAADHKLTVNVTVLYSLLETGQGTARHKPSRAARWWACWCVALWLFLNIVEHLNFTRIQKY